MDPQKRVFFHKKDRIKNRYEEGTYEFEVSEIAYELFLELTQVPYSAINRAYPKAKRERDPKLEYKWADAHHQAKEFLTRYKNQVKDVIIPLVTLTKHKESYDDSEDQHTQEFKKYIVGGALGNLYGKLTDYGPFFLPAEDLDAYKQVLDVTYEKVKEKLITALAPYEAEGKFKTVEDFLTK